MPLMVMRLGVSGLLSVEGQPEAAAVDAVSAVDTGCAVAVPPVLSQKDDVATATATRTAPVRLTGSSRVVASGCSEGRRYARIAGTGGEIGKFPHVSGPGRAERVHPRTTGYLFVTLGYEIGATRSGAAAAGLGGPGPRRPRDRHRRPGRRLAGRRRRSGAAPPTGPSPADPRLADHPEYLADGEVGLVLGDVVPGGHDHLPGQRAEHEPVPLGPHVGALLVVVVEVAVVVADDGHGDPADALAVLPCPVLDG